jgi:hypothetical protein
MQTKHEQFLTQRQNAKKRNIDWQLTEQEWIDWWEASGHFHERGRGKGKWLMARFNDSGPYSLTNIFCHQHGGNVSDAQTGKPKSIEQRAKMSAKGGIHSRKKITTPLGDFESTYAAGRHFGITGEAVMWRLKQTTGQYKDWKYANN